MSKLTLNKETLFELNETEIAMVGGGYGSENSNCCTEPLHCPGGSRDQDCFTGGGVSCNNEPSCVC